MRTSSPSAPAGCRCSTSPAAPTSGELALEVGPGVFVPRPETELLVDLAAAAAGREAPVVVDLATGSGAIALAVKQEWPAARVYAVEAHRPRPRVGRPEPRPARAGRGDRPGDTRDAYPDLDGVVDVVTCNPPYIPRRPGPGRPRGPGPRPARALYGGSATDWGCRSRWRPAPRHCCATEAPSSWSTPTLRVPRCPGRPRRHRRLGQGRRPPATWSAGRAIADAPS